MDLGSPWPYWTCWNTWTWWTTWTRGRSWTSRRTCKSIGERESFSIKPKVARYKTSATFLDCIVYLFPTIPGPRRSTRRTRWSWSPWRAGKFSSSTYIHYPLTWFIRLISQGPKGDAGDKGDRGYTTTLSSDQFPTGIIEGPPGPPGLINFPLLHGIVSGFPINSGALQQDRREAALGKAASMPAWSQSGASIA